MHVVRTADVMDRRRREVGFDELDPPAVDDLVVGRRRDCDRPAEVMRNAETHATDSAPARADQWSPIDASRRRVTNGRSTVSQPVPRPTVTSERELCRAARDDG
jgi:hypothetical protein